MINNRHPVCRVLLISVYLSVFTAVTTQAAQTEERRFCQIEVFTIAVPQRSRADIKALNEGICELKITVYEIDGIKSVGRSLSHDLPADPERSKQLVQQRIQHLDEQARSKMQSAALGLAKVMQYGISLYPAIVFDGQAVVYGVTDLHAALAHYQTWRTGGKP